MFATDSLPQLPENPTRAELSRTIQAHWPTVRHRAGLAGAHAAYFAEPPRGPMRALGSSHKVELGETYGALSAILYLPPAERSGRQVCAWAGSCAKVCLGWRAGQLALSGPQAAQLWRAALYWGWRQAFWALLRLDLAAHQRKAQRLGKQAVARLDGSSDLGLSARLAREFPAIRFVEYTKSHRRALAHLAELAAGLGPANLHYTYSLSEAEGAQEHARAILAAGGSVAAVFAVQPQTAHKAAGALPESWEGFPVIDGDSHDLRHLDPPGTIAGLRFKASEAWAQALAAGLRAGFVLPGPRRAPRRLALVS